MKNRLGFLGFLGLFGLSGFLSGNYAYCSFFGILIFLRYFWVIPDELFIANVQKAATPAFFVGITVYAITGALTAFFVSTTIFMIGLVTGFAASLLVFTLILVIREFNESRGK